MFRANEKISRAYPVLLVLTGVIALLPTSWLSWTRDLSDVVRLPITPLAHAGNRLAGMLRPVDASDGLHSEDLRGQLELLESDRDRYERLYRAQRLRSQELAAQLRLLQHLPESVLRAPRPPMILPSDVTGRNPRDVISPVELELEPEIVDRVLEGDVATWKHQYLVGRVVRISPFRVTVLPVTHPDTGPVQAVLVDPGNRDITAPPPRLLLKPLGDGTFAGEVNHRHGTTVGDEVVLADPAWPDWAQALQVGTVEEVRQLDEAPLRDLVIVRPRFQLFELPHVMLLARDGEGLASGDATP